MNLENQIVVPGNRDEITGINKKVRCKGTHPYISNLLNDIDVHPSDVRTCTILAFEAGDDMPALLFLRQFECKARKTKLLPLLYCKTLNFFLIPQ